MYIQIVSFPLLVGCLLHKQWLKTSNITPQQLHNRVCGTKFVIGLLICGHIEYLHSFIASLLHRLKILNHTHVFKNYTTHHHTYMYTYTLFFSKTPARHSNGSNRVNRKS